MEDSFRNSEDAKSPRDRQRKSLMCQPNISGKRPQLSSGPRKYHRQGWLHRQSYREQENKSLKNVLIEYYQNNHTEAPPLPHSKTQEKTANYKTQEKKWSEKSKPTPIRSLNNTIHVRPLPNRVTRLESAEARVHRLVFPITSQPRSKAWGANRMM